MIVVGVVQSSEHQISAMRKKFASVLLLSIVTVVFSTTDPGDLDILMQFRDGLENPELLKWPENGGDPCGPPSWK